MNRQELVEAMALKAGISKTAADAAVKAFIETVGDELQNGGKVQLIGFGSFETSKRAARTGRNPQTGATTKIAACTAPKFKAGKALKDKVNTKPSKKSKK
ncbi:MAG: HU family DNA-binding protein [Clostridiales bacterium]|nr:HU family DNA-binding protein [Clostridiales bacterium]